MHRPIAVILAGGESKRMGFPKALLELRTGQSFLQALILKFSRAGCRVLTVVGKHAPEIRAQHPEAELVHNPRWRRGQFSSVRAGLRAALALNADAVLVHPVDMPLIRASTLQAILRALDKAADGVVPCFDGSSGHPLGLTRRGAQNVLKQRAVDNLRVAQNKLSMVRLTTRDPAILVNLNSPQAYRRALALRGRR